MITDDDLDAAALQAKASLERWINTKEAQLDRKGSVGRQIPRPVEVGQRGRVSPPTDDKWKLDAACRNVNGDWMTLPRVQLEVNRRYKAKELAVCASCPVIGECLEAGLREPGGIWGGKFPRERQAIKRKRKAMV